MLNGCRGRCKCENEVWSCTTLCKCGWRRIVWYNRQIQLLSVLKRRTTYSLCYILMSIENVKADNSHMASLAWYDKQWRFFEGCFNYKNCQSNDLFLSNYEFGDLPFWLNFEFQEFSRLPPFNIGIILINLV